MLVGALVSTEVLQVPLWVDLTAVVVGALAGAGVAVQQRFDIVGGLLLAVLTGLGGGLLRDVMLGVRPVAVTNPSYLPTVAAAAIVGCLFATLLDRLRRVFLALDAASIGLFTVVGVEKALRFGLPVASAIFIGVAASVGGGVLRDVIAGRPVEVVRRGPWNATAALAGAGLYSLLDAVGVTSVIRQTATIALVMMLRLGSIRWGLQSPLPPDLSPRRATATPPET